MVFISYLAQSLLFNGGLFFKHWYVDGLHWIYGTAFAIARRIERMTSLRVQLHFLFTPLYQERNIIGYVLGFIIRGSMVVIGGGMIGIVAVIGLVVYGAWAIIPAFVIIQAIRYWL